MSRKGSLVILGVVLLVGLVSLLVLLQGPTGFAARGKPECNDKIDNDGDGLVDYPNDPGCINRGDKSELGVAQCDDGIDNDGDGLIDMNDPGCTDPLDTSELNIFCGDKVCNGNETCTTCSSDCGACPPPPAFCGDNTCNSNENCSTCSIDCGECPPQSFCGDGVCNGNETCTNCAIDCGQCPPFNNTI